MTPAKKSALKEWRAIQARIQDLRDSMPNARDYGFTPELEIARKAQRARMSELGNQAKALVAEHC